MPAILELVAWVWLVGPEIVCVLLLISALSD